MAAPELFEVGSVIGTHGLRGDLKVRLLSSDSTSLLDASRVFLARDEAETRSFDVARAALHKGNVLLRLKGVEDVDLAAPFRGCRVLMRYDELSELPEDEHYLFELKGMRVVDRQRGEIGTLKEVFSTGAHDVYVVEGPFGEVMIPAVKQFVVEIDREERQIHVDLPEGLIQEPDEV